MVHQSGKEKGLTADTPGRKLKRLWLKYRLSKGGGGGNLGERGKKKS